MGLGSLIAAVDELVATDPRAFADGESIVEIERQLSRLKAVASRSAAAFDTEREWAEDGARTASAWIAWACRLPRDTARSRVSLGRRLRDLPACERAWLAGDINDGHVRVMAAARTSATAERLAQDEEMLLGYAKSLSFGHFAKTVRYWSFYADPDGSDRSDHTHYAARSLYFSQSIYGLWFGNMTLDSPAGDVIHGELDRLTTEMFEADWAAAKARLGRAPLHSELDRTPAQRRADALVEMAIRSRTAPPGGQRPAPLFTVLVGWETLYDRVCELSNGTVLAPSAVVPWLDGAQLERVVFGPQSLPIDVGARRRLFRGATRRAVEVAGRECFHQTCEIPAEDCEADHIVPFIEGGPTIVANGQLACDYHNRWRTRHHQTRGPS